MSDIPDLPRPAAGRGRRIAEEAWLTPTRLLVLVAVVVGSYAALNIVAALRTVLVMLLVSLFLSFAMEPAVQWLARRGMARGLATGLVFVVVLLAVVGLFATILPAVVAQLTGLVQSLPRSVEEIEALLDGARLPLDLSPGSALREQLIGFSGDLGSQLQAIALGAAGNVVNVGTTAFTAVFQLFSIALVTFYLVADGPRARRALARALPVDRQREMLAIWELAVAKTGGYIYSRVLLAGVAAAATALFLLAVDVPYPLPLGLFVGVTGAFVPVVGTYVGGVLVLVVAVGTEPVRALWCLGFLAAYQQVENYLIAPRVQARTLDVHPAVAFVAVLVGGTLLGAVGALLALPVTAIVQALLGTYVRRHQLIAELGDIPLPGEPGYSVRDRRRTQEARA